MSLEVNTTRIGIYGRAGTSKTTSALSVLKDPNVDKVIFIALEGTADKAIRNAFRVWDLYNLPPEKLFYCKPVHDNLLGEFEKGNGSEMSKIWDIRKSPTGVWVSWDRENNKLKLSQSVKLPPITDSKVFNERTYVIIDGFSALVTSSTKKAKAMSTEAEINSGMPLALKEQGVILWTMSEFFLKTTANIIVTLHEKPYVPDAAKPNAKLKSLKTINPHVGSRSIVEGVMGYLTDVFYAQFDPMTGRYWLSVAENDVWTRTSLIREQFKEVTDAFNNELKANGVTDKSKQLALNNLPQDLTHPCFNFLK